MVRRKLVLPHTISCGIIEDCIVVAGCCQLEARDDASGRENDLLIPGRQGPAATCGLRPQLEFRHIVTACWGRRERIDCVCRRAAKVWLIVVLESRGPDSVDRAFTSGSDECILKSSRCK